MAKQQKKAKKKSVSNEKRQGFVTHRHPLNPLFSFIA
jgi:hypothetical protein